MGADGQKGPSSRGPRRHTPGGSGRRPGHSVAAVPGDERDLRMAREERHQARRGRHVQSSVQRVSDGRGGHGMRTVSRGHSEHHRRQRTEVRPAVPHPGGRAVRGLEEERRPGKGAEALPGRAQRCFRLRRRFTIGRPWPSSSRRPRGWPCRACRRPSSR